MDDAPRFFTNEEGLWLSKPGHTSSVLHICVPDEHEAIMEAMAKHLEHEDFGE